MNHVNSSSLPKSADIAIIGAGVMGAAIAFHLAKRQAGKIVIIDKDHVGRGGSGRSSALIRMHYSLPAEVELALISLRMFQNWQEIVGAPGDFHKTGFVRIVHPNEIARLKLNVEMQRKLGAHVELIDGHQIQELEPDWNVDDVELAPAAGRDSRNPRPLCECRIFRHGIQDFTGDRAGDE